MPNRYEREIEEILRNLERNEPGTSSGRKGYARARRPSGTRQSMPVIHLSFSEWCLILAFLAAISAGGWAYAQHTGAGNLVTGIIALFGAACIVAVAVSPFFIRRRSPSASRYNNVTPLRRSPFSRLSTRWHLFLLKLRYRRQRDHRSDD
jgi:hypothetical protein